MTQLPNEYAWIGQYTAGARVLAYFCEDDKDELHRRQIDINKKLGIDEPQSALRQFHMQSRAGMENLLMIFDKGVGTPTPFYKQIVADITKTKAQVVILDNAAQLFGGNENDRREVTQFINLLHRLAGETATTIILLGHPAKPEASEYSGSTAWDACFRSRLYFARPKKEDGDETDPNAADMRVLRRPKANYSRIGDEVHVKWSEGAFVSISGDLSNIVDRIAMRNVEKQAREKFLELLDKFTEQGRNLSHSPQAKNYAPKMMGAMQDNGGHTKKQFSEAMESLLNEGVIMANAKIGAHANRTPMKGIARTENITQKNDSDSADPSSDDCTEVHNGSL